MDYYTCDACGRLFNKEEVKTHVPDDASIENLVNINNQYVSAEDGNQLIFCEECRQLSHFERRQLYLLNGLVNKKPHGYWKEAKETNDNLSAIKESLENLVETKVYISGEELYATLSRTVKNRQQLTNGEE